MNTKEPMAQIYYAIACVKKGHRSAQAREVSRCAEIYKRGKKTTIDYNLIPGCSIYAARSELQ